MDAIPPILSAKLLAWCTAAGSLLRRRRRKLQPRRQRASTTRRLGGLARLRGWREIERAVATAPAVSAWSFQRLSTFLQALEPQVIDRGRLTLLLDAIGAEGQPVGQLGGMLPELAEWRLLVTHGLCEAQELGLARNDQGQVRLTPKGSQRLAAARADGFSREAWLFVERCLRERPEATCSSCASPNRIHWYWAAFDCRRCGRSNRVTTSPAITRPRLSAG
jgi:hypothetical protein